MKYFRIIFVALLALFVIGLSTSCEKEKTITGPTVYDTTYVEVMVPLEGNCAYYWITYTGSLADTAVTYIEDQYLCVEGTKWCVHIRCEGEYGTVGKVYPLHKMIFSTTPYWETEWTRPKQPLWWLF